MKTPRPPAHLSERSSAWFKSVVKAYEMQDHHVHMLVLACEALDRGEAARRVVEEKGTSFPDKNGMPKVLPEVLIQRDCAVLFARLCRELCLDNEVQVEPRVPRKVAR